MTMKVTGLNNVYFRGGVSKPSDFGVQNPNKDYTKINELSGCTPDYNIRVPQKYTQTGIDDLPNGLKLYSYKLSNGYKVSIVPMKDSPAVVKTYVNVGAVNETQNIKGISHFLEHMAFNGTNGENGYIKLETGDSFKKIDALGGWANASTNYALTDYVNSAPLLEDKDLETQIRVLAAMTEDLKLSEKMIEKEKGPVCSEINMILDDPKTVAMDQTVRTLFNIKNPADEFVAGSVKHIQNLTRKDVLDYYNKYYYPENTNIVITGDVNPEEVITLVSKNFVSKKMPNQNRYEEKLTPINETVRKDFVSDKAKSAEIVLGFAGAKNNSVKEKLLFNIAANYVESESVGLSEGMKESNTDFSIDDEKISTMPDGKRMIYLGATSSEENVEKVLKMIYDKINNIKPISETELERIKEGILQSRSDNFEYSDCVNSYIGNAILDKNIDDVLKFEQELMSISAKDVDEAVKKYFDLSKTALTVVHPSKSDSISFKGAKRMPVNMTNFDTERLDNNIEIGFYNTDSKRCNINLRLVTDTPYNKKPAVREILNQIYTMGTSEYDETEFNKIKENINLGIQTYAGADGINISIIGNEKNYKKGIKFINDLLYNPRINEETLNKAKDRIRERISRSQTTASSQYFNDFYSKYNEYAFSDADILKNLDSVTLNDVKDFHDYVLRNSRGIVTSNIPIEYGNELENNVKTFAESMHEVLPNTVKSKSIYNVIDKPVVLTSVQNNSQADIKQVYNFKYEDSPKNKIVGRLMSSILSNSSIGLFNTLREKEHLAYSVYSDITTSDDLGEISLNILTTTDNKDNGEQHYDNVRKSIEGFNRQIDMLKSGKFTEEDLESAKRFIKAQLLNNEGVVSKVSSIDYGMNSKYGAEYKNKLFDEVDNITKEDITEFASNALSGNPVYSITATEDTLKANKDFINSLKI
ncbi:insulinase family protein [bacterium]|nr:insulinase family protein [bacterium]